MIGIVMTRQSDVQSVMKDVGRQTEKSVVMRTYDQNAVNAQMQKLRSEIAERKLAEQRRAEELAAVEVDPAAVTLVAEELCISKADALSRLQEKKGNMVAVLREAVGLPKAK